MKIQTWTLAVGLLGITLGPVASADDGEAYDRMVKAPALTTTMKSLSMMIMASPYNGEKIEAEVWRFWWANQPGVDITEETQNLAAAQMRRQIATFRRTVLRHDIRQLYLAGINRIGTKRNLDLFLAAETKQGPVIFRVSVTLGDKSQASLHEVKTFEGWEEAREADAQIQFHPGDSVASVSYTPTRPPEITDEDQPR